MEKTPPRFHRQRFPRTAYPLTSIQGYTETLLDSPSARQSRTRVHGDHPQERGSHVPADGRSADTGPRRIGEQRFDMQRASPEELLQDALESFREVARSYGVELLVENSTPAAHVNADREAIHQIFSNLIENALKYAASGKKVILGARAPRAASNSTSGTSDREFPPSICPVFSSASTASIKRARGNRGARGWDSPSQNILFSRMGEQFVPRANSTTARPFCLLCPLGAGFGVRSRAAGDPAGAKPCPSRSCSHLARG